MAEALGDVGQQTQTRKSGMLLSDTRLRQIMGILWLLDGLLQVQPQMFTMNMVNGVMTPTVNGQPAPVAASLHWIISITTQYLVPINWGIALIQIVIGVWLLSGRAIRPAILLSVIWALVVWYAGEGMSMLLTGQASILTGAPGAVLLYPLIALTFYPRQQGNGVKQNVLSRGGLRNFLAGFWVLSALLQLQPYWWQSGQISQQVSAMFSPGTLGGLLIDPSLHWLSGITSSIEVPLNIFLIVVFLALGVGLFLAKDTRVRSWLIASIVVSLIIWWFNQALGMILTGMATDFNSGLLLIIMALACWPRVGRQAPVEREPVQESPDMVGSSQV
jgi:hypothetical protein